MLKRLFSTVLTLAMLTLFVPNISVVDNADVSGFEKTDERWNVQSSNGRMTQGYDMEKFHSGEQSYKSSAVMSASGENEVSAISRTFDIEYKMAYKI